MISSIHVVADHPCLTTTNESAHASDFWERLFANKHVRDIHLVVRPTIYTKSPWSPVQGSVALLEHFWKSLLDAAVNHATTFAIEHITIDVDESVWTVVDDGVPVCVSHPHDLVLKDTLSNSEISHEAVSTLFAANPFEPNWTPLLSLQSLSVPLCMVGAHPELAGCFLRMLCPNAALPALACTVDTVHEAKTYMQDFLSKFHAAMDAGAGTDAE